MSRIGNSWRLIKASAAVLMADKRLVIFPIVSGIASAIVVLFLAGAFWATGLFDQLNGDGHFSATNVAALFVFYLVLAIIINFCNAALVGAALMRLRGGNPTVGDGFRLAADRMGPILGYSLISATVGVILQAIRDRGGTLGEIGAGLAGGVWGIVTYLVLPVLVVENIGPVEAIKRSGSLLRRTWGEQIVGGFGLGLAIVAGAIIAAAIGVPIILLGNAIGSLALIVVGVIVLVALLATAAIIGSALKGIYTAALYRYAADGATDSYFDADLIHQAFQPKSKAGWVRI